jgi:amino acid transporter
MFTFISFWRTAAVVLCDMSSTVFYLGAIAESAIGKAAPWFILAVLAFSYGMRAVYIESCALFTRGGVYRVVKEALGGFLAKLSVSALLFDYVLTGPISAVSAGQYIVGLALEALGRLAGVEFDPATRQAIKGWGSVLIAAAITLYFLRLNLLGIHESSGKALKIMLITTVLGVVMIGWSAATLAVRGPTNELPTWKPDLSKKVEIGPDGQATPKLDPVTGEQVDPLGWLGRFPSIAEPLRHPASWLSLVGFAGVVIAFGHSILAMSGEETLAQVYREVEAPKLRNFKKAALVVFLYSLLLTGSLTLLCTVLIPDRERMTVYYDNWIGGLAMHMIGPAPLLLLLNAFVVVVGFLVLSGAVNTSIVGSNGVLSRVAEDGVLPDWFLRPHPRFGTTYRLLFLIAGLQLFTIVASRGNVLLLGEAYAFGVVWSFVFKTLAMVVLRFKDRGPREFVVPLNVRFRGVEIPVGLTAVMVVVSLAAAANFFTKPVATVSGLAFTGAFLATFVLTETHHRRRRSANHEHLEQFNQATVARVTAASLRLTRPYCKLVAIRSTENLVMLDKALDEADPLTTDVVVMTAKAMPRGGEAVVDERLGAYERRLLTAVVNRAERLGKTVTPLVAPTNNPLHAVLQTAKDLPAQEIVLGASNKFSVEEQLDQVALYWINLHGGEPRGLTVHIIGPARAVTFDLHGGARIPTAGERQAKSVAELREAGVGVRRVLAAHDGAAAGSDLFDDLLTMLAPEVTLDLAPVPATEPGIDGAEALIRDQQRAARLGRSVAILASTRQSGPEIVRLLQQGKYDLLVMGAGTADGEGQWRDYVRQYAPCSVFVAAAPAIPRDVDN